MNFVVENPVTAGNLLNNNLGRVHSWASVWLVDFNASKTESMLLTRKRNKPIHPDLIMDNTTLNEIETHKHLGLGLNLSSHNDIVSTKIYDKRDDFNFDIVNFPFLDGDVPRRPSYGVYISQLIRFARASSHVS